MAFSFIVEGAKTFASKALPELGKKVLTDAAVKAGSAAIGSVKDSFTGKASQGSPAKYNIVQFQLLNRSVVDRRRASCTSSRILQTTHFRPTLLSRQSSAPSRRCLKPCGAAAGTRSP